MRFCFDCLLLCLHFCAIILLLIETQKGKEDPLGEGRLIVIMIIIMVTMMMMVKEERRGEEKGGRRNGEKE